MPDIYAAFTAGDSYLVWDTPVSATTGAADNITDIHNTAIASQIQYRCLRGSSLPDATVSGTGAGKFDKSATCGNPYHHGGDDYPGLLPS